MRDFYAELVADPAAGLADSNVGKTLLYHVLKRIFTEAPVAAAGLAVSTAAVDSEAADEKLGKKAYTEYHRVTRREVALDHQSRVVAQLRRDITEGGHICSLPSIDKLTYYGTASSGRRKMELGNIGNEKLQLSLDQVSSKKFSNTSQLKCEIPMEARARGVCRSVPRAVPC